ncbi:MAG: TonB-dependent receptor [Steroidobacteraceae bacterium]|jgi:iron complex outermembrane receptor protein|nr:TonB-dependent receptor [Steroidobacteraceae bacterium]
MSPDHLRSPALALAAAAALGASFHATESRAQENAGATASLEEVTVTARKREESLQDVPISITAFSAEAIADANIYDVRDIARFTPNINFQSTGGNGTGRFMPNLIFRGLQNAIPLPRSQTGAVFLDGNYVLGGVNAINTSDVERVEVLRGPQNTYFGRNTFAGAINFVTRNPSDELSGAIDVQTSERSMNMVNASVEGPLTSWMSGRLALGIRDKQGHYVANDGGRLGSEETNSVAGTLMVEPAENAWIRARVSYQEDDDGPGQVINLLPTAIGDTCRGRRINNGTNLAGTVSGFNVSLPYFCDRVPTISQLGERIVSTNTTLSSPLLASLNQSNALQNALGNSVGMELWDRVPRPNGIGLRRNVLMANLQGSYEFDNGISIGLNVGYDDTELGLVLDSDRTDLETQYTFIPQIATTRTYELRVRSGQKQRLRWLVGATRYSGQFISNFGNGGSAAYESRNLPTGAFRTGVLLSPALGRNPYGADEKATVEAVYGSVDFDILANVTLSAEVRYQQDSSVAGRQFLPTFAAVPAELEFTDTLPRVILEWEPTEDWNLYASYSKGVLPGTENTGFTQRTPFQQALIQQQVPNVQGILGSDELDSYEIGSKQTLLGGRLRYNVALYYMEWNNIKGSTPLVLPRTSETNPTPLTLPGVAISGAAEFYGVELEGAALITDNWDFGGGIGYQHGEFTDWFEAGLIRELAGGQSPGAIPGDPRFGAVSWKGSELQRQPNWTANFNSTYRGNLNADWTWSLRGELIYTGEAWDSTANIVRVNDFYRANLRLAFERDNLTLELFSSNLFNDQNWDFAFRTSVPDPRNSTQTVLPLGNTGVPQGFAALAPDKRDVGLRIRYQF